MNNKNRIFNQEELEEEMLRESRQTQKVLTFKKSKHSLDSDEEDEKEEAQKYNVLDPNDLEGQEDKTIEHDGEIRITPFNMKEELEEGYFDKEGTYIFEKEEDVVKDQWLDDIDWVKVKSIENIKRKQMESDEDSDEERPAIDLIAHYSQMLELMKPKETVQKAIVRLGGSTASRSASSRWKKKKEAESNGGENGQSEEDIENLRKLTSLADSIIHSGDMDIYQQTYEKMQFLVNAKAKAEQSKEDSKADPELDMFGDDFEEKVDETKASLPERKTPSPTGEALEADTEVMWEFKWEEKEDAKIYGPYPTSQMLQWVQDKYFEDGVFVRQVGKQDANFYSSKRIDFDLYI